MSLIPEGFNFDDLNEVIVDGGEMVDGAIRRGDSTFSLENLAQGSPPITPEILTNAIDMTEEQFQALFGGDFPVGPPGDQGPGLGIGPEVQQQAQQGFIASWMSYLISRIGNAMPRGSRRRHYASMAGRFGLSMIELMSNPLFAATLNLILEFGEDLGAGGDLLLENIQATFIEALEQENPLLGAVAKAGIKQFNKMKDKKVKDLQEDVKEVLKDFKDKEIDRVVETLETFKSPPARNGKRQKLVKLAGNISANLAKRSVINERILTTSDPAEVDRLVKSRNGLSEDIKKDRLELNMLLNPDDYFRTIADLIKAKNITAEELNPKGGTIVNVTSAGFGSKVGAEFMIDQQKTKLVGNFTGDTPRDPEEAPSVTMTDDVKNRMDKMSLEAVRKTIKEYNREISNIKKSIIKKQAGKRPRLSTIEKLKAKVKELEEEVETMQETEKILVDRTTAFRRAGQIKRGQELAQRNKLLAEETERELEELAIRRDRERMREAEEQRLREEAKKRALGGQLITKQDADIFKRRLQAEETRKQEVKRRFLSRKARAEKIEADRQRQEDERNRRNNKTEEKADRKARDGAKTRQKGIRNTDTIGVLKFIGESVERNLNRRLDRRIKEATLLRQLALRKKPKMEEEKGAKLRKKPEKKPRKPRKLKPKKKTKKQLDKEEKERIKQENKDRKQDKRIKELEEKVKKTVSIR